MEGSGRCLDDLAHFLGDRVVERSVIVDDHLARVGEVTELAVNVQDVDRGRRISSVGKADEAFMLERIEILVHALGTDEVGVVGDVEGAGCRGTRVAR